MSKDERDAIRKAGLAESLTEALRPDFDKLMPSPYYFTPNQAAAIIIALEFVLGNPCDERDNVFNHEGIKPEHVRSALKVFKA